MTVSIVANTSAKYAQRAINNRNELMTASTERLSSGIRVYSAGQDAAAMAVGTSLKVENATLTTAALNVTSASSMLQIADGSLGQIGDILVRLKTLATQAASDHLDDTTRGLVNQEFSSLKAEVDRIANVTSFNGVSILTGTPEYAMTGASDNAAQGIAAIRVDTGTVSSDETMRYSYDPATESLTLTRIDGGTATTQSIDLTVLLDGSNGAGRNLGGGQKLEVNFAKLGVTLTLDSNFDRGTAIAAGGVTATLPTGTTVATPTAAVPTTNVPQTAVDALKALASGYNATSGALTLPLVSDGTTVTLGAVAGLSYKVGAGAVGASGAASANLVGAGTTVEIYADIPGGGQALVGTVTTGAVATSSAGTGSLAVNVGAGLMNVKATGNVAPTHLTYKVGGGVVAGEDLIEVDVPAMTLQALGMATSDISTAAGANAAMDAIDAAQMVLNQGRANVGAQQVRMDMVASNLSLTSQNNESARSALLDVDVSKEISDYSNNSAMMQASVAMLTKANQLPDMLLAMLKGG